MNRFQAPGSRLLACLGWPEGQHYRGSTDRQVSRSRGSTDLQVGALRGPKPAVWSPQPMRIQ
jgi:hypothetical protein